MENSLTSVWAKLKKRDYFIICVYLVCLILIGITVTILIFIFDVFNLCDSTIGLKAVFLKGIPIEITVNAIYYLRRLYKKSINSEIVFIDDYEDASSYGVLIYIFTRPVFGVLFYFLASVLFEDLINSVVRDVANINGALNPWIVLLAVYVGHTTGNIIDIINDKASKIMKAAR